MSTYKATGKIWVYPGDVAWHFFSINKALSKEIKEKHGSNRRGFGSLPVRVTVGATTWETSIFPSKDGTYLLPIKAKVRSNEGIYEGDELMCSFTIR